MSSMCLTPDSNSHYVLNISCYGELCGLRAILLPTSLALTGAVALNEHTARRTDTEPTPRAAMYSCSGCALHNPTHYAL